MARMIAVISQSGFGKSTSIGNIPQLDIKGLDPKETAIINVMGKDLPFKGWKSQYSKFHPVNNPKGNYMVGADPEKIAAFMEIMGEREDIKNIVIDDWQYIMATEYMDNALKGGFEKFNKMASNTWKIINAARNIDESKNVVFLAHSEELQDDNFNKTYKMKTLGKMIDNKITMEGLFTVLLYCKQEFNQKDKKVEKFFVTNFDGEYPAKSPIGMFDDIYIKNDLGLVVDAIDAYNS